MKKKSTTIAAAVALLAGSAGLSVIAAPAAQAVTVSGSEVKYVFCSDNRNGNHVAYYDYYGRQAQGPVSFPDNVGGNRWCGSITVGPDRNDFALSSISNDNSPYVYAAIYEVTYPLFSSSTGAPAVERLVAVKESYQSRGGFNYAIAG